MAGFREVIDGYCALLEGASAAVLAGAGDAGWCLRLAELESVIAQRMAARAVVSMHRALLAGASLAQVAEAAGMDSAEAAQRWRSWADGQRHLGRQVPGLGLGEGEYLRAASVIEADAAARREPAPGCGHAGGKTQIGSPRP